MAMLLPYLIQQKKQLNRLVNQKIHTLGIAVKDEEKPVLDMGGDMNDKIIQRNGWTEVK